MQCGMIIAAAGSSRRMGASLDKTTWGLAGQPVIAWSLDAVAAVPQIRQLVIVVGPTNEPLVRQLVAERTDLPPTTICRGGETRRDSVAAGVECLDPEIDLVLIHDAARPMVTPQLLEAGIAVGSEVGAAVAAVPVSDTIKRVDKSGLVLETPNRDDLYAVQTPQVFRRDWLQAAYAADNGCGPPITDEASLVERAGFPVRIYPGSPENLKLTTPTDLVVAQALLNQRVEEKAR